MTTTFQTLYTILENADFRPRSYSGRGMYGRQCIGVTCDSETSLVTQVIHGLLDEFDGEDDAVDKIRDALEEIGTPSTDAMGRSIIVYWPSVEWEEPETEDEDDED